MTHALRPEGLDFLTAAPVVLHFSAQLAAPREAVFAALTDDPSTWARWFPGLRDGGYGGPPPWVVGTPRWVRVGGMGTYRETVVEHVAPERWTYRVDSTTTPMARALMEQWVLADAGSGTAVTWHFAIDPKPAFRLTLPVARPYMGRLFAKAMRNLDTTIARG